MNQQDFEELSGWAYQRAGRQPDGLTPVEAIARAVLGPAALRSVPPRALPGDAALATVGGVRAIFLRTGLPKHRARWAIAHELGHVLLGLDSSRQEHEDVCDAFAATLLLPTVAFQEALLESGPSFRALARRFTVTESCAALRVGEVTGVPLALVAPARVRVRGSGYQWPSERELRALKVPGAQRVRLKDDRQRMALLVG